MKATGLIEQALAHTAMVIPSIEGRALLERLLPTIDLPLDQVVVVEQGSQDGSEDFCRVAGVQVLQLRHQAAFTHACNAGIRWALERGFQFICIANNDLRFVTPVVHQLLATCLENTAVGAVAPTQVMITDGRIEWVAYRGTWDLSTLRFGHDIERAPYWPRDVDADFCEFTCVLVPRIVFEDVGLLDEDYGFYHEDADFGFRIWKKGYRALYNQEAQIFHWGSSTVKSTLGDKRKRELIRRNRKRFADKHLEHGINFLQEAHLDQPAHSWDIIVDGFSRAFRPLGLLRPDRPTLALGHPGQVSSQYLYVVWETTNLPEAWLARLSKYEQIFVSSSWTRDVFHEAGFKNTHLLPLGVDINIFQPSGPCHQFMAKQAFLVNARPQQRKALDVTLSTWDEVKGSMPDAELVLYCPGDVIGDDWLGPTSEAYVNGKLYRRWYPDRRIELLQPRTPLTSSEIAALYRGARCLITNSRSEGFGLPIVEAMACGTLCIVPDYGATREFIRPGNCLPIGGTPVVADYSDKGFGPVGQWWEPSRDDLRTQLIHAYNLPQEERRQITTAARNMVARQYSWRAAARTLYGQLAEIQSHETIGDGPRSSTFNFRQRVKRAAERLVRGHMANGLVQTGKMLEKAGNVLRSQGVTSLVRKFARVLRDRLG